MPEASGRVARWRPGDDMAPLRALVARGGVLAIPTESSYGLAVDPRSHTGVERIYALKERERGKPLPVVAADVEQVIGLGLAVPGGSDGEVWPPLRAVANVWPAPLTIVLPLRPEVEMPAAGGDVDLQTLAAGTLSVRTLAVRVPAHDLLRELLAAVGSLTATSANRAGEPPILDPEELDALLASSVLPASDVTIVDGGVLAGGSPSTLIRWDDAASRFDVLRAGRYPVADLPEVSARG